MWKDLDRYQGVGEKRMLCNAHSKWDGQTLHCASQTIIGYVGSRMAKSTRPLCRSNVPFILTCSVTNLPVTGQSVPIHKCDGGFWFKFHIRSYRDSNDCGGNPHRCCWVRTDKQQQNNQRNTDHSKRMIQRKTHSVMN